MGETVSPMTLLQNPMILMGLVAMVVLVGMPKLMDNSEPPSRLSRHSLFPLISQSISSKLVLRVLMIQC